MVSVQSSVIALYRENNEISLDDLKEIFKKAAESSLSTYLSVARNSVPVDIKKKKKFNKITEQEIEKVIIEKLNKSLDNTNIRLAMDFLKIKRLDSGTEDDLDIEKFLKKFKSNTGEK